MIECETLTTTRENVVIIQSSSENRSVGTTRSPIEVDGDSFRFNPDLMYPRIMYGFEYLGKRWFAFRQDSEEVHFLYLPDGTE
jgi:hypothetical protein